MLNRKADGQWEDSMSDETQYIDKIIDDYTIWCYYENGNCFICISIGVYILLLASSDEWDESIIFSLFCTEKFWSGRKNR